MSRFVLTAQLQLQAPTNTAQVVRQIQNQLNGVQVNVQVQGTAQATRQVNQVAQSLNAANSAASNLGRTFAISVRRFTALAVATRAVSLLTNTLAKATDEAIQFERELVRVSQVTGKTVAQLRDFTKEITSLATGLGVSSTSLIKVGTILAQAGFNAEQTTIALRTLAKTELSPTFDNITETAEGVVAIFNQFRQGAEALEEQLGSINSVSAKFAVESGDLIGAVRRVGGVFKASGGSLNELIALFTSVRATTRESAESIATGLRTIFTRIQRPKTIQFLKQFGVELLDLEGKFVGPFEAVRRLSNALAGLEKGDVTFIRIAEELGGFRQIGKVIPLLQQFQVAQEALNVAQKGGTSLTDDAATAQAALAIRITKVKEEFLALVRSITETSSFQLFANTALNLASALIKLADALKPIIPLLAAVATIKLAKGVSSFITGFGGGLGSRRTFNQGGKVLKFASGGMVPGTGNRDTVRAMVQPGEFVMRKKAVDEIGAENLAAMNENGYAAGGKVNYNRGFYGSVGPDGRSLVGRTRGLTINEAIAQGFTRAQLSGAFGKDAVEKATGATSIQAKRVDQKNKSDQATAKTKKNYPGGLFKTIPGAIGGFFLTPEKGVDESYTLGKNYPFDLNGKKAAIAKGSTISNFVPFRNDLKRNTQLTKIVDSSARSGLRLGVKKAIPKVNSFLDIPPIDFDEKTLRDASNAVAKDKQVYSTVGGYLFEGIIQGITGAKLLGGRQSFDFPNIANNRDRLAAMFAADPSSLSSLIKADAKRSKNSKTNKKIVDKLRQDIQKNNFDGVMRMAKGGIAQRNIGYIDSDILNDPANKTLIEEQIAKLAKQGIKIEGGYRGYKKYLSDLAAKARTSGGLRKLTSIIGLPGSGKSTMMMGNARSDNARLRKTSRFPILTPEDVARSSSVIDVSASLNQKQLESSVKASDRVVALSSSTKEEQNLLRERRKKRDREILSGSSRTGFGRRAGSTTSAPLDSGYLEALLQSEIDPKKIATLGITPAGFRRKSGTEIPKVLQEKINLYYGNFGPTTRGHSLAQQMGMEKSRKKGVQKSIVAIGTDTPVDPTDVHSYRSALMSQRERAEMASRVFPGAYITRATKEQFGFGLPSLYDVGATEQGQRLFVKPQSGSTATVGDEKSSQSLQKYKDAGLDPVVLDRIEGISGTKLREAISSGDLKTIKRLTTPEGYEYLKDKIPAIQKRTQVLPKILDRVSKKSGFLLESIEAELSQYPSRITSAFKTQNPELAAKIEELRKQRDKIKSSSGLRPVKMMGRLGRMFPSTYGMGVRKFASGGLVPGSGNRDTVPAMLQQGDFVIRKRSVNELGAENLASMAKYAAGGGVDKSVPALVTPGEFVFTAKDAKRIGYGSLNRMNKVGKYATGGTVGAFGPKKFANGGQASGGGNIFSGFGAQLTLVTSALQSMIPPAEENASALQKISSGFLSLATQIGGAIFALEAFGISLNAKNIAQLFGTGPQGLGGMIKNAFSGFKMGAAGMAGPMPLGGGIASRIGGMFGSAKATTKFNLDPSLLKPSFSLGRQGKGLTSLAGGQIPFSARIGNIAGRATQGINVPNLGIGRGLSAISKPLSPYTSAIPTGFRAGFAGKNIVGGNALSRGIGGISSGIGSLARGAKVGFTQKGLSFGDILSSNRGLLAKSGGILGKSSGALARGAGSIAGGVGGALGGIGGAALSAAGPIAAITGVVAAINSVVGNFRDLDGQIKDSIAAGKTEEAVRLSITKKASEFPVIGNIVSSIFGEAGDSFLLGVGQLFGGPSLASVEALARSQIGAVAAQKALNKAQDVATNTMKQFEDGTISAAQALAEIRAASNEVVSQEQRASGAAIANLGDRAAEGTFTGRNILTLGGLLGETNTQRNRRLGEESATQIKESSRLEAERFSLESGARRATIRSAAATGSSPEDIKRIKQEQTVGLQTRANEMANVVAQLESRGDTVGAQAAKDALNQLTKQINQTNQEVDNLAKEVERAKAAFDAMNLGMQKVAAVSGALSVGLENYLARQEAGNIGLDSSVRTLQASITSAAQGISDSDFKSALNDASSGLRELGASEQDIKKFEENLSAINTAQKSFAKASEAAKASLRANLQRGAATAGDAGGRRKAIAAAVTDELRDVAPEVKDRISKALEGAEISDGDVEKILGGDLSVLDKILKDLGETTLNQVVGPLQELTKYNKVLVDLTKKRIDAENNVIAAQRGVLEAQLEAQEIIAKYGGPALTPQGRSQNAIRQANIQAQGTGVSALRTGSAAELNQRSAEARNRLAEIGIVRANAAAGDRGAMGQLEGQAGAKLEAEEKRLQALAKSDYETTKQLIKNKEEELKLVKEKNSLERSSIDALVSGDIDKFFEQQAAVGAQAAIASGSTTLQNAFGASALGAAAQETRRLQEAGVQELYGQKLAGPGGLTERAYGSALGAMGVGDQRLARVAAGSTAEESAIEGDIRSLAATLPNFAETQLLSSEIERASADLQFQAAEMQLTAARETAEARARGMSRGGPVYASRGIFVPRGTDTIPAMLTPGEFVVRREAVQRGNNLQVLQAMNKGNSSPPNTSGAAVGMNRGGIVRYRDGGSNGPEMGGLGISPEVVSRLSQSLDNFNKALEANINKLDATTFNIKLDTTNINVNLTGTSFLSKLADDIRSDLIKFVGREIQNYGVDNGGKLRRQSGPISFGGSSSQLQE